MEIPLSTKAFNDAKNKGTLEHILRKYLVPETNINTGSSILDEILKPLVEVDYAITTIPELDEVVAAAKQGKETIVTAKPAGDLEQYVVVREFERIIRPYIAQYSDLSQKIKDIPITIENAAKARDRAQAHLDELGRFDETVVLTPAEKGKREAELRTARSNKDGAAGQVIKFQRELEVIKGRRNELTGRVYERLSGLAGALRIKDARFAKELALYEIVPNEATDPIDVSVGERMHNSYGAVLRITDLPQPKQSEPTRRSAIGTISLLLGGAVVGGGITAWLYDDKLIQQEARNKRLLDELASREHPFLRINDHYVLRADPDTVPFKTFVNNSRITDFTRDGVILNYDVTIDPAEVNKSPDAEYIITLKGEDEVLKYALPITGPRLAILGGKKYILGMGWLKTDGKERPVLQFHMPASKIFIDPFLEMTDQLNSPFIREVTIESEDAVIGHEVKYFNRLTKDAFTLHKAPANSSPVKVTFSYSMVDLGNKSPHEYTGRHFDVRTMPRKLIAGSDFNYTPKKSLRVHVPDARKIE